LCETLDARAALKLRRGRVKRLVRLQALDLGRGLRHGRYDRLAGQKAATAICAAATSTLPPTTTDEPSPNSASERYLRPIVSQAPARSPQPFFTGRKLRHALFILLLAESPILLQLLHLDRTYLYLVFSLAWALALYSFVEPPRRAFLVGLAVYVATALLSLPLLLYWLQLGPEVEPGVEPSGHALWEFVFGVGVREELCKAVGLSLVLMGARALGMRFSAREGLVYGAVSGLAFAAVENLRAVQGLSHLDEVERAHGIGTSATIAAALTRLVLTPLAHACWGALLGYALTVPVKNSFARPLWIVGSLFVAATLHGLYDDAASFGNSLGVGILLALSFALTLALLSRSSEPAAEPRASAAGIT
jgi:RsiW-degrading membrane proteinase PrsW (M82 family)